MLADQFVQRALLCIGFATTATHRAAPAHYSRAHRVRRVKAAAAHPQPRPPARAHAQAHELVVLYQTTTQCSIKCLIIHLGDRQQHATSPMLETSQTIRKILTLKNVKMLYLVFVKHKQ